MEIEWIKSFTAVVEKGGYQEAAFERFLSQSVISKHIQKMEKELGVKLFSREHRRAELTAEGEKIYRESCLLLKQYQKLLQAAEKRNHLQIGMMPVSDCYSFPDYLSEYDAENPELELLYEEQSNTKIPALLQQNKLDGAFYRVRSGEKVPENSVLCKEDRLVVLCRKKFLQNHSYADLKNLDGKSIMIPDQSTGLYEVCLGLFENAGIEPDIIYTGASGTIMLRLVKQNVGIAILAQSVAESICTEELKILPLIPEVISSVVFAPSPQSIIKPEMQKLTAFIINKYESIDS